VLTQHIQIDMEFRHNEDASDFLQCMGCLATKVGNLYFEIYEAASSSLTVVL
jgi:hypothetical protein